MQIPILSGVYADGDPDIRTAYPVNMEPIPKVSGISQGYLRTAQGLKQAGEGPGICRGGIEWNGVCYRVMGSFFGSVINGVFKEIGRIEGTGTVSMDYGFGYLSIAGGNKLYLFNGNTLEENTDEDLGDVLDAVWIDGYYITTDGEFIVSTDLTDPFSVNPFKYGSSEEDADPVLAVKKLGSELFAVNRHTIEAFTNVGGTNFPFQVIDGTQVYRGAVGTHAVTHFMGSLAFVGSARKESPGIYMLAGGEASPISTAEIETVLADYTEDQLKGVLCESRSSERRELLYVHLPDQTLVYDGASSAALGQPVWFVLKSRESGYRARHFVWCENDWSACDTISGRIGVLSNDTAEHWGDVTTWEFVTPIAFSESVAMQCHELTLTGLPGAVIGDNGAILRLSFSEDGRTYSEDYLLQLEGRARRKSPLKWTRVGYFEDRVTFRVRGDSNARLPIARMDAVMEAMAW